MISFIALLIGVVLVLLESNWVLLVTISITSVAPVFWFRKYHKKHRQYLRQYKIVQGRLNNLLLVENRNLN